MLRRLRHKLRMIRYYSAPRPASVWSRAMDVVLFFSFFLALPAAWVCNTAVIHTENAISLAGQLMEERGRVVAYISMSRIRRSIPLDARPLGTFTLAVDDRYHGWPLTTSVRRLPARVDLGLAKEFKPRINVQLPADDPYRLAIERALREDDEHEALAAWEQDGPVVHQQWVSWFIASGAWWLLMMAAAGVVIQLARFVALHAKQVRRERAARRRAQGQCLACGYDMTGLEFNEKCPECGALVW